FFVWEKQELLNTLPEELAKLAIELFNVTDDGNFESSNILYLPQLPESYAKENNIALEQLRHDIQQIRELLYKRREQRIHPVRDEKVITAWNGMMITTLALAGEQFAESRYTEVAIKAANFIWKHNRPAKGELYRIYLNGKSSVAASQEDYAWMGEALVTLYDVTTNPIWLQRAQELADGMIKQFHDPETGGFYMSGSDAILAGMVRGKNVTDAAIPSGNSVALSLLSQLAIRTGELRYGEFADETMATFATMVERSPLSYTWFLLASEERIKGETGSVLYAGQGVVQAKVVAIHKEAKVWDLSVKLNIAEGWHVNSHRPIQEYLIATAISLPEDSGWKLNTVDYPQPVIRNLGFSRELLALYEGELTITATLIQKSENSLQIPLTLKVQSCSEEICLAPEKLNFSLSTARE
ncbi:MAG: thioredoxin, partial [Gammaproteobacteria bacterium]|nr:thioredoxin [Gammaproteobacteria bacterium]